MEKISRYLIALLILFIGLLLLYAGIYGIVTGFEPITGPLINTFFNGPIFCFLAYTIWKL